MWFFVGVAWGEQECQVSLELEFVSNPTWVIEPNVGPLEKLYLLLIANPPLQFLELVFKYIQPVCAFFFPGWLDYCLGLFSLSIRGLIV